MNHEQDKPQVGDVSTGKASYTPGPWECGHGLPGVYVPHLVSEDGDVDFDIIVYSVNNEANAQLIAAAPELLEALQAIFQAFHDNNSNAMARGMELGIEAIAKALGQS